MSLFKTRSKLRSKITVAVKADAEVKVEVEVEEAEVGGVELCTKLQGALVRHLKAHHWERKAGGGPKAGPTYTRGARTATGTPPGAGHD